MVIKTYEDGSEMTVGKLSLAIAVGAVTGIAVFAVKEKISDKRTKRWMKKQGYPQEVLDRY